ncbi:hypothetical protein ACFWSJ_34960 [Streptomyces niveus]|uniref:hypothetical protein n=1 Tax=Streptomyces niveus TaxID=193462 RepID=UPI0036694F34
MKFRFDVQRVTQHHVDDLAITHFVKGPIFRGRALGYFPHRAGLVLESRQGAGGPCGGSPTEGVSGLGRVIHAHTSFTAPKPFTETNLCLLGVDAL